jgi:RND family efflux transporter MFP subunit
MKTLRGRSFLLAAMAAALLSACRNERPEPAGLPDRAESAAWIVRDTVLSDRFEASGIAEPVQRAQLASRLMARVNRITVREGDRVTAGQVLAALDARDLDARQQQSRAGRAAAQAAFGEAETHARRIRALFADSAAPRAQLDQAEATLARAEAALRQADAAAQEVAATGDYATLRAPFAGVITRRFLDPGGFAAPGQPVLELQDDSRLRLSVTAPPVVAARVRRDDRVAATIEGRDAEAVVEGVVPAPGGNLMTVNAIIRNPKREWFPGSAATLAIPLGARSGVLVPVHLLVREGDLTGVRVRRGGSAELRWIRLGAVRGGQVEVLTGLAPGDTLLAPVRGS